MLGVMAQLSQRLGQSSGLSSRLHPHLRHLWESASPFFALGGHKPQKPCGSLERNSRFGQVMDHITDIAAVQSASLQRLQRAASCKSLQASPNQYE